MATRHAEHDEIRQGTPAYAALQRAAIEVARELAQAIARDGEGATKFITIEVQGAASEGEAVRVAKAIAHSPLALRYRASSDHCHRDPPGRGY